MDGVRRDEMEFIWSTAGYAISHMYGQLIKEKYGVVKFGVSGMDTICRKKTNDFHIGWSYHELGGPLEMSKVVGVYVENFCRSKCA